MGNFDSWMPKWFHILQKLGLAPNYSPSMFITKVPISLLEAVLGLVLPLHTVLVLQIYLRLMKMVPIDYPYPKTLGLTPKSSLPINNFTPWSCSWPPSAPPPCSWPSDQSEALVNGPKWFSIPQNHGLDTKLLCSMNWIKVTIYAILAQNTHFRPTFAIFQGIVTWGLTTSYVKNFEFLLISTYQSTF